MSKTKNIESIIKRTERRILKLNREANKAYQRNHNIIAVNSLNKVVFLESLLEKLKELKCKNPELKRIALRTLWVGQKMI